MYRCRRGCVGLNGKLVYLSVRKQMEKLCTVQSEAAASHDMGIIAVNPPMMSGRRAALSNIAIAAIRGSE